MVMQIIVHYKRIYLEETFYSSHPLSIHIKFGHDHSVVMGIFFDGSIFFSNSSFS